MSQDQTKTSKTEGVFKSIHRRMSSFGKSSRTSELPYETMPSIADQLPSSNSSSRLSSVKSHPKRRNDERDTRLISLDKLMDGATVADKNRRWFEKINIAVRAQMNSSDYDCSHDYEHIQRVVMSAHRLWHAEKDHEVFRNIDPLIIYVAAMVHDVGDGKYLSDELVEMDTDEARQEQQRDSIELFIRKAAPECPPYIWGPASHVAALVSFTRELRNPVLIAQQCAAYPALQIVQDSDRLDGLGAVGIIRGAVYGGATEPRGTGTVRRVVHVVDERHARYVEMMKTRSGKREAAKRWEAMEEIRDQIMKQANCEHALTDLENNVPDLKASLRPLQFVSAREIEVGHGRKAIVIFVPVPLLSGWHKAQQRLTRELEKKFSDRHVLIVASRRILPRPKRSNRSRSNQTQKRPQSRTLTAVHDAILTDLVFPVEIVGKRLRTREDGSKILKVVLDEKERGGVDYRLDTYSEVYKRLTGKGVNFEFPQSQQTDY
ncbi:hypothetical protein G6011_00697 [Alternaria panax]|uniref:HD/PDEase domain-containing protein n=1 Tax=Alternaria panax TaxID=48097 RepID=A0AAD4NTW2_9PLEO|nr:hypothetical protein G6011_00697 [Alternaria panax]